MALFFGPIISSNYTDSALHLSLQYGSACIRLLQNNCLSIKISQGFNSSPSDSYAIEMPLSSIPCNWTEEQDQLVLQVNGFKFILNKLNFSISLLDKDSQPISVGLPFSYDHDQIIDTRESRPYEDYYGLGERMSPFGRRGYKIVNYNTDDWRFQNETTDRMYVSLPFFIGGYKDSWWGYFLDSSYRTDFDMGCTNWNKLAIKTRRGDFSLYLMAGQTPKDILRQYMDLTGTPLLAPHWSLGYHQCRWGYQSTKDIANIAKEIRSRKIPCDALWYDIDHMDNFRVFTLNPQNFADMVQHAETMHSQGFKNVAIVDPGVKADDPGIYSVYDEGTEKGYFLKRPDGQDYVGKVWPGGTKFPDFSHPVTAKWWGDLHSNYYSQGFDAFWNDMNEPADMSNQSETGSTGTVPEEVRMFDQGRWSTMDKMHNVYGLLEAKATQEGMLRLKPKDRPFILTRAGYSGIQKYAAIWCGDNASTWAHLKASVPQILNMGMSGIGFCGVDVGGFTQNTQPELLVRWTQAGSFFPFFRNHSCQGTTNQEPWAFGPEVENNCRKAIELRYHLIPYYAQLFTEMHLNGDPILRPLFWDYQNLDQDLITGEEFLIGSCLLASPVLERGRRDVTVTIPEGVWYDYETGTVYHGPCRNLISAPLDKVPLFIRESSVMPVMPCVQSTQMHDLRNLFLEIVPGNKNVSLEVYEEDGQTNDYKTQGIIHNKVSLDQESFSLELSQNSKIETITIRLFRPALKTEVNIKGFQADGIWLEHTFSNTRSINISL